MQENYQHIQLNQTKLKPGLGAFYAMWPEYGSGLLYSSRGLHRASDLEMVFATEGQFMAEFDLVNKARTLEAKAKD